jgi:hypothetical protein
LGQKTTGNSAHMAVDELQPTKECEVGKMFMAIDLFQLQTGLLKVVGQYNSMRKLVLMTFPM